MVMHSVKGPFPMDVSYEFEEAPSEIVETGTLVKIRVRGEATWFFKLASPLLAQMVKKKHRKGP